MSEKVAHETARPPQPAGCVRIARAMAVAGALLAFDAAAAGAQEMMAEIYIGKFTVFNVEGEAALADEAGAILYTYENDPLLASVCTGRCAKEWPPAVAGAEDTGFEGFRIITRPDGIRQWTHQGRALYRSAADAGPGQATSMGTDGLWHIVKIPAHHM